MYRAVRGVRAAAGQLPAALRLCVLPPLALAKALEAARLADPARGNAQCRYFVPHQPRRHALVARRLSGYALAVVWRHQLMAVHSECPQTPGQSL